MISITRVNYLPRWLVAEDARNGYWYNTTLWLALQHRAPQNQQVLLMILKMMAPL